MKSQGEIEAAVCDGISRFQQEFIGRGPRDIHSHLLGDLLVVRLQGVLTPAERQLISPRGEPAGAASAEAGHAPVGANGHGRSIGPSNGNGKGHVGDNGNGRALLKQIRAHMVSAGRPRLAEIVASLVADHDVVHAHGVRACRASFTIGPSTVSSESAPPGATGAAACDAFGRKM
jgi:uncharacterized protein YbcI